MAMERERESERESCFCRSCAALFLRVSDVVCVIARDSEGVRAR